MSFDWQSFFRRHRIEYVTAGRNVASGHIAVKCPWCGPADPSQHLGIALSGAGWGCLRNKDHRGKSEARLVAALLKCSMEEADIIVGKRREMPSDFMAEITRLLKPETTAVANKHGLTMPKEFREFTGGYTERLLFGYLRKRSYRFSDDDIRMFADEADLRWCLTGPYRYRIVFPIYDDRKLVTWTARAVGDAKFRYKTLSHKPEKAELEGYEPAHGPITDYLLWGDALRRSHADTLVICEGPFDAWRVRTLGWNHGIDATCLFTASASRNQLARLAEIAPRYRRLTVLLDAGTLATAIDLRKSLAALQATFSRLPDGVKDPGDLASYGQLWDAIREPAG